MSSPPAEKSEKTNLGGFPLSRENVSSFDGGETATVKMAAPDRYRFFDHTEESSFQIPRGAGLSYCGASFGQNSVSVAHVAFDRLLDFDSATGEVEVEGGISLLTLFHFLIRRGYYLPCHPGHGSITIGGCIAADSHGKNHVRDGTFARQVLSLKLFHPTHGVLDLSPQHNAELFNLTCGGFGLTGHILSARLKTKPIKSHLVKHSLQTFSSFQDTVDALEKAQNKHDYAYSWHDLSRPGEGFGAGFVHAGDILENSAEVTTKANTPKDRTAALLRRLPAKGVLNYYTTPVFNRIYRAKQKQAKKQPSVPLETAVFPLHGAEAYFSLYGRAGFHEVQMLFPFESAGEISEFLEQSVARNRLTISLASAKIFDGEQELLRFSGKGLNLALNFPRTAASLKFLSELDSFIVRYSGRPNIIKDSRLPRSVVEACYPQVDVFREQLKHYDPKRLFRSELSTRLAL